MPSASTGTQVIRTGPSSPRPVGGRHSGREPSWNVPFTSVHQTLRGMLIVQSSSTSPPGVVQEGRPGPVVARHAAPGSRAEEREAVPRLALVEHPQHLGEPVPVRARGHLFGLSDLHDLGDRAAVGTDAQHPDALLTEAERLHEPAPHLVQVGLGLDRSGRFEGGHG